jgi:ABC-type multidrug transport system fused ATPase/permease subunit
VTGVKDITIIFRYLLPALKPYAWAIIVSLGITGIVIGTDLLQPYCFKNLLDAATLSLNYQVVLLMLLVLLGLAAIRSVVSYWEGYARSRVGEGISEQYRKQLFEHVLHLPLATLHETESGVLQNRIMNDCGTIGRVYVATQLLPLMANLIQAIALIGFILILSWQVGLASIVVFPLGWLIAQRMTRRSHTHMIQLRSQVERGQGILQEVISGVREIRVTGNEAGEMRRWTSWLREYGQVVCSSSTERQFVRVALGRLIDWVGLCVVFGWGGLQLLQHHMTIGGLLAIALYVQQLYSTLTAVLGVRIETSETANALQAINMILDLPREWPERGIHDLGEVHGQLEFADVSFSYNGSVKNIQHVSLKSTPGEMLGIVGPTGSGKSTLMNLCLGFYPVTEGKILLDGHNIAEIAPHVLRQQIGVVSQDVQLWNTTIRENLLYGLRREVPWDQVLQICEKTSVHAFVQLLPNGYETIVGSRGVKLSGGEKQRIALARVLLRDPKILLLDEATSALDSLTEAAITNTLLQMFATKNRILVAHRLATVQSADQIIVLENGKIVEVGAPHILCQQNGLYADLYRTQKLGMETSRMNS